jgi:hypothetical protein
MREIQDSSKEAAHAHERISQFLNLALSRISCAHCIASTIEKTRIACGTLEWMRSLLLRPLLLLPPLLTRQCLHD